MGMEVQEHKHHLHAFHLVCNYQAHKRCPPRAAREGKESGKRQSHP